MRLHIALCLCAALAVSACSKSPSKDEHTYTVQGQVIEVAPDHQQATVKHEEIKGFMMAMTMPYKVQNPQLLNGIVPGDLINAKLLVGPDGVFFTEVKKVGEAPLEQPAGAAAGPGADLLKPGEPLPDATFVDQNGRKQRISAFKGAPLAITFIYTSCPLPDFCPLMDRNFAAVQESLAADPALKKVHLVSISFDPAIDTPAVLKKHAGELKANPARWTFLTGDRDEIDKFASRLGMTVSRSPTEAANITHNLRTAVVDSDGRLVKVYTGNEWIPAQLLSDLKALK
jgi:protein SCO1/2